MMHLNTCSCSGGTKRVDKMDVVALIRGSSSHKLWSLLSNEYVGAMARFLFLEKLSFGQSKFPKQQIH